MHNKEQKILKSSMILLFLALIIVYVVWYQVQGNQIKPTAQTNSWPIQILSKSWDILPTISAIDDQEVYTEDIWFTTKTGETLPTTTGTTKTTTGTANKNTNIQILSGTSIYYGPIAIIEKLGIKYQYALTDQSGSWFIYLGTPSYDFTSITRALKGTTYTIATEQELIQNKLFGNKVVYLNLPEYKDKQVIMLVYMDDGIWLVQIEYTRYHKSKAYLKSLFID